MEAIYEAEHMPSASKWLTTCIKESADFIFSEALFINSISSFIRIIT